jgi:hypothetical protein
MTLFFAQQHQPIASGRIPALPVTLQLVTLRYIEKNKQANYLDQNPAMYRRTPLIYR